jgi:hypothetical protein
MAKSDLEAGQRRSLMVSFEQEYDAYWDNSTGGGDNDGYILEVRGSTVVSDADGSNIKSEWSSPSGLGSFWAVARTLRRDGGDPSSCKVEYRDLIRVSAFEAKQMVKVFDKVERALAKADERDGYHKTIGQYLSRVARAVGATSIVFLKAGVSQRGGFDTMCDDYVWLNLGHAVDAIDSRINLWVERKQAEYQKARAY